MGRWFGYRPGYLDCCKLFTSQDLIDRYDSTTLCVEELKAEFKKMDDLGRTPSDFEIRVRTHEGVLQITRPSILKNTELVKWSYQDSLQMSTTINVEKNHISNVWSAFKTKLAPLTPCVRIVVASVFHKNITGSGKLDISEALS